MGIYNYEVVTLLTDESTKMANDLQKEQVIERLKSKFNLIKDRSVYYCDEFALRVSTSKSKSFSNTVLSLSALKKYDDKPFIALLITPYGNECYLANSTFLKKISHSSHELRVDNIKGSFNGSDILKEYDGIPNEPCNFERLFAIHQAYTWEENVERLVESTNNISPNKRKLFVEGDALSTLLSSPVRAEEFLESPEYVDLRDDLNRRVASVKDAIAVASLIDNVNLRGRVIEELITSDDPEIINSIKQSLEDGVRLSIKTDQKLGDYSKVYEKYWTETDIKTKVLFFQSAPKAYNIDKLLGFLSKPKTVYLFFLIGIGETNTIKTRLISIFDKKMLTATRIQHHWAGRNSRGVTQLDGNQLDLILENDRNTIEIEEAQNFLQKLIDL